MALHATMRPIFKNGPYTWQVKYTIGLEQKNGQVETFLDDTGSIKTNICGMAFPQRVEQIFNMEKVKSWDIRLVGVPHNIWCTINAWYQLIRWWTTQKVQDILNSLWEEAKNETTELHTKIMH